MVHKTLKAESNKHTANYPRADHFHSEKNEHKPPSTDTDHFNTEQPTHYIGRIKALKSKIALKQVGNYICRA